MSSLENEETIRLKSLLQAFEAELYDLARLAESAQSTLSNALLHAAGDADCHREAQMLDLLTQRLYGMAGFLTTLAPGIPPVWQVDTTEAVKTVSLRHLADRLNGVQVVNLQHDIGKVEMF